MLQKRKPQGISQITPYIMAFTAVAYVVMGGFVIKRQWLLVPLTPIQSYAMGALVIAYGLFRGWRAYHALKDSSQD
jgi:hypothetical protein